MADETTRRPDTIASVTDDEFVQLIVATADHTRDAYVVMAPRDALRLAGPRFAPYRDLQRLKHAIGRLLLDSEHWIEVRLNRTRFEREFDV